MKLGWHGKAGLGTEGTFRFFFACLDLRAAFFSACSRRRRCFLVSGAPPSAWPSVGEPRSGLLSWDASPASSSLSYGPTWTNPATREPVTFGSAKQWSNERGHALWAGQATECLALHLNCITPWMQSS